MSIKIQNTKYNGDMTFEGFPFELSDFQKHSLDALEHGENVLVTAPTGCGKTLIAEHVIKKYSSLDLSVRKRKVIYTSPIKALSNCLFNEFRNKFPSISFGILTGDIKFNPDADCVIMTTEILRNLLYNKKIKTDKIELNIEMDVYQDVAAVIFDEVHYISDKGRGRVWEESLILLPKHIQLVMLSATIEKPEGFGQWVQDIKQVPLTLASEYNRVVPLKHYLYTSFLPKFEKVEKKIDDEESVKRFNNNLVEIMDNDKNFNSLVYDSVIKIKKKFSKYLSKKSIFNDVVRFLKSKNLLPTIMFTLSRKKCETYAKSLNMILNSPLEQSETLKVFDNQLRKTNNYKSIIEMNEYFVLKDLLVKGIAYHHSGVYPVFKEAIEILLGHKDVEGKRHPLIKVLFATETFAVGVNMPTKAVCYTGITKYSDDGFRTLAPHEYNQMSGRAGRRGIDKKGVAILLPNLYKMPTSSDMKNMMCGKNQSIQSKFIPNFQFLLKLILTGNNQIMSFVKKSLLDTEIVGECKYIENKIKSITLPEGNFEKCIEYDKLVNPNSKNKFIKLSQKARKRNARLANEMKKQNGFQELYQVYSKYKSKLAEKDDLMNRLQNNNNYINSYIIDILDFMSQQEYIKTETDIQNYDKLEPKDVSVKGIIASQINECNELLFTEIITSGILDDLNCTQIALVFSIFIDTRLDSDCEVTITSMDLPYDFKNTLHDIVDLTDEFYKKIQSRNLYLDLDWNIYLNLMMPVYDWINGCNIDHIINKYGIYSGNFVKDVIKLNNIIQDVVKVASLLEKMNLLENASKIESFLIRDNINIDSLYVKT